MPKASGSKVVQEAKKRIEARIIAANKEYDELSNKAHDQLAFLNGLQESMKIIEMAEEGVLENADS